MTTVGSSEFAVRPQLAEDVAGFVRRRIFDGTYAAGTYVRLEQLAADLGSVSPRSAKRCSSSKQRVCSTSSRGGDSWCGR